MGINETPRWAGLNFDEDLRRGLTVLRKEVFRLPIDQLNFSLHVSIVVVCRPPDFPTLFPSTFSKLFFSLFFIIVWAESFDCAPCLQSSVNKTIVAGGNKNLINFASCLHGEPPLKRTWIYRGVLCSGLNEILALLTPLVNVRVMAGLKSQNLPIFDGRQL